MLDSGLLGGCATKTGRWMGKKYALTKTFYDYR